MKIIPFEKCRDSLEIIECDCGYHMGVDVTFIDAEGHFKVPCPTCKRIIDTEILDTQNMDAVDAANFYTPKLFVYRVKNTEEGRGIVIAKNDFVATQQIIRFANKDSLAELESCDVEIECIDTYREGVINYNMFTKSKQVLFEKEEKKRG